MHRRKRSFEEIDHLAAQDQDSYRRDPPDPVFDENPMLESTNQLQPENLVEDATVTKDKSITPKDTRTRTPPNRSRYSEEQQKIVAESEDSQED